MPRTALTTERYNNSVLRATFKDYYYYLHFTEKGNKTETNVNMAHGYLRFPSRDPAPNQNAISLA